jgi:hypothetical protein
MLNTVKRCTKVTHRTHKFVRGYAGGCNEATIVTPEVIKTKLKAKLKVKDLLVEDSSGECTTGVVL